MTPSYIETHNLLGLSTSLEDIGEKQALIPSQWEGICFDTISMSQLVGQSVGQRKLSSLHLHCFLAVLKLVRLEAGVKAAESRLGTGPQTARPI